MKKSICNCILIIATVFVFFTAASFASSDSGKSNINNAMLKSIENQLPSKQQSKGTFSHSMKSSTNKTPIHKGSYSNPISDDAGYIQIYYPEYADVYSIGNTLSYDFYIYDTWTTYKTRPVIAVFDLDNNLMSMSMLDVVDVDGWKEYSGNCLLSSSKYPSGIYKFSVLSVPCYSDGTQVSGWASWSNIPQATVTFIIKCNEGQHKWGNAVIKKKPTCTADGKKTYTCSTCCLMKTETIPAKGHDWGDFKYTVDRRATRTRNGSKNMHCIVCGYADPAYALPIYKLDLAGAYPPKTNKVSAKKLKKKSKTINAFWVDNYAGKISCKIVGGKAKAKKVLKLKKNGKITVKKKTKKGTYKLKIKVSSKGTVKYAPMSETIVVTVIVK